MPEKEEQNRDKEITTASLDILLDREGAILTSSSAHQWITKEKIIKEEEETQFPDEEEFRPAIEGEEPAIPGDEEFQSREELEKAIEDILERSSGVLFPVVHSQINKIGVALEENTIDSERGLFLLKEAEEYINKEIERWNKKPPVNHYLFTHSRSQVLDGLHLYREGVSLMRDYIKIRDPSHLNLSRRLSEQALEFLIKARNGIWDSEV